jgi:hypothetical protein
MTIELTNEEKLGIVEQHIKSIDYGIYGIQLDLIELNATSAPDASQVTNLNTRLTAYNAKRAALVTEKNSLTPVEE